MKQPIEVLVTHNMTTLFVLVSQIVPWLLSPLSLHEISFTSVSRSR